MGSQTHRWRVMNVQEWEGQGAGQQGASPKLEGVGAETGLNWNPSPTPSQLCGLREGRNSVLGPSINKNNSPRKFSPLLALGHDNLPEPSYSPSAPHPSTVQVSVAGPFSQAKGAAQT